MIGRMLPMVLAALAASNVNGYALPQGVTDLIEPPSKAPAQCSVSVPQKFGLAISAAPSCGSKS